MPEVMAADAVFEISLVMKERVNRKLGFLPSQKASSSCLRDRLGGVRLTKWNLL
jgi:hypothetical protein